MTISTKRSQAFFETTKRLLAGVINEGLVEASVRTDGPEGEQHIFLHNPPGTTWVRVNLKYGTVIESRENRVVTVIRPDTLKPPVIIGDAEKEDEVLDPGILFTFISPWFSIDANNQVLESIAQELRNSAENQERWLYISAERSLLSLNDSSLAWERSLITGHPSHPFHRLCFAQAPLKPVKPEDIPGMLTPSLSFVSVPRENLRLTGPFEKVLQPFLKRLKIPGTSHDKVIVPCLTQQLPSIRQRFPNATLLKSVPDCVDAQASMRTLTIRPEWEFRYHLKLSLACQITSALRTITPWSTSGGPVITEFLERLLPVDLWVFGEVAAVTGAQEDFSEARHLSCILRNSLEERAKANDEVLIISAAFTQQPQGASGTYAEVLFGLETISQKHDWFQRYIRRLFELVLPPLVDYGIGLEAHGQNMVARVCRRTGQIKGFAVRDFGGVRLHAPTLRTYGVKVDSLTPGAATLTDNLSNVWSKVHHSLLQNHVGFLLEALGLEQSGGWSTVRGTLLSVLTPYEGAPGEALCQYFLKDTMPLKCFLRMRMEGKYRDYVERELPNVLLTDGPRWEHVLNTYKSSLHYT